MFLDELADIQAGIIEELSPWRKKEWRLYRVAQIGTDRFKIRPARPSFLQE
jgi:hypothetical protein